MSNKNRFNANSESDPVANKSDDKKITAKPLPLPQRNEITTNENSNTQSTADNITDNSDNAESLAALMSNISTTNNADQNNTTETKQNKNIKQNLINIVTKIWSQVYTHGKPILARITKLPASVKKSLSKFAKFISLYCFINVNEFNENDKIENADTVEKVDSNTSNFDNKKQNQSQIESPPKSKNLPNQNIVIKNHADSATISPAMDLYGEDNDIYEGFSWQNILVKSAIVIVALLLLVAGYIGIRPILNPKSPDEIATINPNDEQSDKTDNNTPDALFNTQNQTPPLSETNKTHADTTKITTNEIKPASEIPEQNIANNYVNPPNKTATVASTSSKIENENANNPASPDQPPLADSADLFTAYSSPAINTNTNPSNAQENIFPSTPSTSTPPFPNDINVFAASLDSPTTTITETPPITQPENNSPFDNTTNTTTLPTDNTIPPSNNSIFDHKVENNQLDVNKIDQTNEANNVENKREKIDEQPIDKLLEHQNTTSDITLPNNDKNTAMVPLMVTGKDSVAETKNTPDAPNSSITKSTFNTDFNTENTSEFPKKQNENESDLTKISSAPMESLQVTKSNSDVLTNADSVPRVPTQEDNLALNQNEISIPITDTTNKQEPPISVTKNDDSLSIVPDGNVQPRFTAATPPTPEKNNTAFSEMSDLTSMRPLQSTDSKEITPSIPTAENIAPIENFSPTMPPNSEPNVKIPIELTPSLPPENPPNSFLVAQNNPDKIYTPTANNLPTNPLADQPASTPPKLIFDTDTNTKPIIETNNRVSESVAKTADNTAPLAIPVNVDDAKENALSALLPSNIGEVENEQNGTAAQELAALQDNAPAVPAESYPAYRRSLSAGNPATIQMQNSGNVLPLNNASVYREQLDNAITKSPEYAELYTVKSGDTYMSICDNYYGTGLLYRALAVHNRNRGAAWNPAAGTQIEIPTADYLRANYAHILAKNNRYNPRNKNLTTPENTTIKQNNLTAATQPITNSIYIVQQDDSIFKIALEQLKDSSRWGEILQYNADKLKSARDLKPGMELILPATTASGYKKLN
ncbi:MAG: LysM peptidoglycan-binding domain-containing protein [Planctomycetaceae bacterium]|jgi:hypothetical protein|nr:LysM peptidoglycan-binding domain-containing protein [Planctomycetaceae bacterium]